jgi:long-chain acyl-CoA synthetase
MGDIETQPAVLVANAARFGARVALRRKQYGIWHEWSWAGYAAHVRRVALGLVSLGFCRGDKLAILGDNDPEWYWAELAAQSLGGVAVGIFVDCLADEVAYYLTHAGARFVIARDQEQVDKLLAIRDRVPDLRKIVFWDPKGLWAYSDPLLMSFDTLESEGRRLEDARPSLWEETVRDGRAGDIAVFCYTSGTTGRPKAAMLSHANLLAVARAWREADGVAPFEEYVSYVAPAWVTEQFLGIALGLIAPLAVSFPESPETLPQDLREIGPARLFYGARLWENVAAQIEVRIAETAAWKRRVYRVALGVGRGMVEAAEDGRRPSVALRLAHAAADALVLRPLRDRVGLARLRAGYTAGAAIAPDTMRFFHAHGVRLKNVYGSTEAGIVAMHRDDRVRYETVGPAFPGCEIRIADDGEIVVRSPMVFAGYYQDPEATRSRFRDGWYATGDAGHLDADGHLVYWDRVSELLELPDGTRFSPQHIEVRLRFSPYVKDVMVVGARPRAFVSALVVIDGDTVGKWAERERIPYTTYVDLSQRPEVRALVRREIERVNAAVPDVARIRRVVVLHKEFDADEAELTRTRKLRRGLLEDRYRELLDAVYGGADRIGVSAAVVYRDGRKGVVAANVFIDDVATDPVGAARGG